MARARNIKPGFFKNEDLVELPFEYRLLFAGLWTLADREGRLEDRPKRIKMEIFPADNVNIEDGLRELARYGFVKRYESQGINVVAIPKFLDHQHPHKNEAESFLPCEDASVSGRAPEQDVPRSVQAPEQDVPRSVQAPEQDVPRSVQAPEQDVPRSVQAPEQDVPRSVQAPAKVRSAPAESLLSESLLSESLLSDSLNHATGPCPVAPRAQAHATPPTAPPVDNFPELQGLATVQDNNPEIPDSSTAPEPAEPAEPPAAAKRKKAPPGLSVAEVVAECEADPQHVQDWQIIRKVPITPTALDGIKREAGKAGISPAEAIRICAENGWRGFKASWLANRTASRGLALARASPSRGAPDVPWELAHAAQQQAIEISKREIFGEVFDA